MQRTHKSIHVYIYIVIEYVDVYAVYVSGVQAFSRLFSFCTQHFQIVRPDVENKLVPIHEVLAD